MPSPRRASRSGCVSGGRGDAGGRRVTRQRIATGLMAISLFAAAGGLLLAIVIVGAGHAEQFDAFASGGMALGVSFAIIGGLIASRRADNRIGWVYLVIALSQSVDFFAGLASYYGLILSPDPLPLAGVLNWIALWAWAPGFVMLATFAILLFPDGRLVSRRWRAVAWLAVGILVLLMVPIAVASWPLRDLGALRSFDGDLSPAMAVARQLQTVGILLIPLAALLSVLSMVIRFRRSTGRERAQLKWFTWAALVEIVYVVSTGFVTTSPWVGLVAAILIGSLLPIATGIAILRYRLYEIDRIISRTLSYAIVTGLLGAVFVAVILVLQTALAGAVGQGGIPVAVSTLAVFALFQPVLRRVRRTVDRRFDRARYDADHTAAQFGERLRWETHMDRVTSDLRDTVEHAVAPASLAIWLRQRGAR